MSKKIEIDYSKPCSINNCPHTSTSKVGLCYGHYQMYRDLLKKGISKEEAIEVLNLMPRKYWVNKVKQCTIGNCTRPYYAKDLCRVHYSQNLRGVLNVLNDENTN